MSDSKKKKKGTAPSKEDAALAMDMIKVLQEKSDEIAKQKLIQEEELKKKQALAEAEKLMIQLSQQRIEKKIKENLKKKEKLDTKKKGIKKFLESVTIKDSKIKWKSINDGNKIQGYVEDKLIFEIIRGMNLFSLYIKDEKLKKEKKLNSYAGCSTNLLKLKHKSDKFV